MEASKIREGAQFMADGDKASTKSWFKKPDWDIAGQYYEKAGTCFKAARSYEQAVTAYTKASEALLKADAVYMAARALESAAQIIAQQMRQPERAAECYKKASDLYQAHMSADRAAVMLERAGKCLEPVNIDAALEYYVASCGLYESEDRGRMALDTFKQTISLMIRHKRFEQAVEMLQRQCKILSTMTGKSFLHKSFLTIVIVLLALGDEVEAGRQFEACIGQDPGFLGSDEAATAQALLEAFEQNDQEILNATIRKPSVNFLDAEVTRLVHSLRIPGDMLSGGGEGGLAPPGNAPPPAYSAGNYARSDYPRDNKVPFQPVGSAHRYDEKPKAPASQVHAYTPPAPPNTQNEKWQGSQTQWQPSTPSKYPLPSGGQAPAIEQSSSSPYEDTKPLPPIYGQAYSPDAPEPAPPTKSNAGVEPLQEASDYDFNEHFSSLGIKKHPHEAYSSPVQPPPTSSPSRPQPPQHEDDDDLL
ncbi:uncharacterized protein VTP21DRAFT_6919 [Calcarisporiella thermophila]|uniref:uncharacterized protein n=1 Tax=Calcarisporiella thermophila TaxID=911321 RepID=UPI0037428D8D